MIRAMLAGVAAFAPACAGGSSVLPDGGAAPDAELMRELDCKPACTASFTEVAVSTSTGASRPSIAWAGDELGVAWQERDRIVFARVDRTGAVIAGPNIVAAESRVARPSLAWNGEDYAVFYVQPERSGNFELLHLRMATVSKDGAVNRVDHPIIDSNIFVGRSEVTGGPISAWNGETYAVAWVESGVLGIAEGLGRLTSTGARDFHPIFVADALVLRRPSLVLLGGSDYAFAWRDETVQRTRIAITTARSIDVPSRTLIETFEASRFESRTANGPSLAFDGESYAAAIERNDGDGPRVTVSRVAAAFDRDPVELDVSNGFGEDPSILWTGSEYVLSWIGDTASDGDELYFTRLSREGERTRPDLCLTSPEGFRNLAHPRLVAIDGGFAIAFGDTRRTGLDRRDGDAGEAVYVIIGTFDCP